jgi:hypothetical protein
MRRRGDLTAATDAILVVSPSCSVNLPDRRRRTRVVGRPGTDGIRRRKTAYNNQKRRRPHQRPSHTADSPSQSFPHACPTVFHKPHST